MDRSNRLLCLVAGAAALVTLVGGEILMPSADATFPGHNGRIAFDDFMTRQIYTISPDGSDLRQLTHVGPNKAAWNATWSPNGRRIAFNQAGPKGIRLRIMNADGTRNHKLMGDRQGYNDFIPRYLPNGRRILFSRCGPDLPGTGFLGCALYTVRTDGTHRRAVTHFKQEVSDFFPSVSPDGTRVAFSRFNAHGIVVQIYIKGLRGGRAHAVTRPALEGYWPDWSPRGNGLVFTNSAARVHSGIFKWRPGGPTTLLEKPPYPHADQNTSYSPNGNQIAFQSDRGNDLLTWNLYTMGSDGTHLKRITTGMPGVGEAAWGPAASSATARAGGSPVTDKPSISRRAATAARARLCALQPKFVRFPQCKTAGK